MDLLERYLQAIGQHLPAATRNDVLNELRGNLEAQIDDRVQQLNRPLTDHETAAILHAHGRPEFVAARYLPQRSLIGPALFPIYTHALRKVLPLVLLIYAIVHAIPLFSAPTGKVLAHGIVASVLQLIPTLILFWFWLTAIFAIVEAVQYHYAAAQGRPGMPDDQNAVAAFARTKCGSWLLNHPADWDPMKLPPATPPGQPRPKSFAIRFLELLVHILWLAYVLIVPSHPYLLFGPALYFLRNLNVAFAPVWHTFYIFLIILVSVQLAIKLAALTPGRQTWAEPMDVLMKIFGVLLFSIMLFTGTYFVPNGPIVDLHTLAVVNHWIGVAFRIALFFALLDLAQQLWKYLRPRLHSTRLAF